MRLRNEFQKEKVRRLKEERREGKEFSNVLSDINTDFGEICENRWRVKRDPRWMWDCAKGWGVGSVERNRKTNFPHPAFLNANNMKIVWGKRIKNNMLPNIGLGNVNLTNSKFTQHQYENCEFRFDIWQEGCHGVCICSNGGKGGGPKYGALGSFDT